MNQNRKINRWLSIVAIIGLFLFVLLSWNDPSFQESHDLTRDQAIAHAADLWSRQGQNVKGWKAQAVLDSDATVDGYLTQYDLQKQFQQKAPAQAPLVYWKVSFKDPHGTRTLMMDVDRTNGKLVSFETTGSVFRSVVKDSTAFMMAKKAVQQVGADPSKMVVTDGTLHTVYTPNLVDAKTGKQVGVAERSYEFQDLGWKIGQMTLKYKVTVSGNQVTVLKPVYELPKVFIAWHDRQKTVGTLLTGLSLLFSFVLFVLGFVFLFLIKEKKRYGAALWLSLAIFVTFLISNLNEMPLIQMELLSPGVSSLQMMIGNALVVIGLVVISFIIAGCTFPMILTGGMLAQQINPRLWSSWRDPDWKVRIRQAMWRGILLAIIWLGFQNLFYWVAETFFGVWSENDFSMSPMNMWMPALFPLMGWLAGIQEELVFRMFGINFFKRYWKNTFIATLIPAIIWALGHSMYPIFPTYTRLIELTMFGVMIGYCYLWFGIETTIFAHVVFDVVQMCIPLLVSGVLSQEIAGFIFLISPILVGYGLGFLQPIRRKVLQNNNIV